MNAHQAINAEELLTRIIARDKEDFNDFYHETVNCVYSLALKIIQSGDIADEVASNVYVYVWQEASRYNNERGNVFIWLMVIYRSRALDALRKNKRHLTDQIEFLDEKTDHTHEPPDLFASIDSDCIPENNWLYEISQLFYSNPDVDVLAGHSYLCHINLYEKAFALRWFFPLRITENQVHSNKNHFFANNFALPFIKNDEPEC